MINRSGIYDGAFAEGDPEASIPLLIHTARELNRIRDFYKDGKFSNCQFLLDGLPGFNHGGTINGQKKEGFQSEEMVSFACQKGLSLEITGVFGVERYYEDHEKEGANGDILIWGQVSFMKWVYIILGCKTVMTYYGPRIVITKVRMCKVTLRELVHLCTPEKIWEGLHDYVNNIHHYEKQKYAQLKSVVDEYTFDYKMLRREDLQEADWI